MDKNNYKMLENHQALQRQATKKQTSNHDHLIFLRFLIIYGLFVGVGIILAISQENQLQNHIEFFNEYFSVFKQDLFIDFLYNCVYSSLLNLIFVLLLCLCAFTFFCPACLTFLLSLNATYCGICSGFIAMYMMSHGGSYTDSITYLLSIVATSLFFVLTSACSLKFNKKFIAMKNQNIEKHSDKIYISGQFKNFFVKISVFALLCVLSKTTFNVIIYILN